MRPATRQRLRLSGGTELSFITAGEASRPAVLLLHGFPSSARTFREVVPELSQATHVIAPDLPGFGESDLLPLHCNDHWPMNERCSLRPFASEHPTAFHRSPSLDIPAAGNTP
jgi:pimeloyl-ACP methyl ester carboxylesterase